LGYFDTSTGNDHFAHTVIAHFVYPDRVIAYVKVVTAVFPDPLEGDIVNGTFEDGLLRIQAEFLQEFVEFRQSLRLSDVVSYKRDHFKRTGW
jgi:hypothetical protein